MGGSIYIGLGVASSRLDWPSSDSQSVKASASHHPSVRPAETFSNNHFLGFICHEHDQPMITGLSGQPRRSQTVTLRLLFVNGTLLKRQSSGQATQTLTEAYLCSYLQRLCGQRRQYQPKLPSGQAIITGLVIKAKHTSDIH